MEENKKLKKIDFKSNRGAITIITLTTVLFMTAFLISTYAIVANRRQAQADVKKEIKSIYEADVNNVNEVYLGYFADEETVIPIYTIEQLLKVGTGEYFIADGKIYVCSADAKYILLNNIEFKVSEHISEYPDAFNTETGRWINIEEQIENRNLTGSFDYHEKAITEVDINGITIEHMEAAE